MTALGLDWRDSSILAVLVDDEGSVLAQGRHAAGDPGVAARLAIGSRHPPAAFGLVAIDPSASPAVAVPGVPAAAAIVVPGGGLALAEQWCGAARGARHVAGLIADDTVSAGVVIDGRLFVGAHGLAGAAGWLALNPVEREDYRRSGCLEAEIGGPGIVRRLVWRVKAGDHSRVLDMAGGQLGAITPMHVFDAAREGDGVAVSVVRDTARYVGMAVANLAVVLDPDVVVLGGAIARAGDLLLEPTRTEVARRVSAAAARQVSIAPAALGELSPAIGAARAAMLAAT